jgi:hypothetical protein
VFVDEMTTEEIQRIAEFLERHDSTIANALNVHAERMEKAANEAQESYDACMADPAVKAQTDASLMHSNGYRQSAEMFRAEAKTARQVATELRALLDGPDIDE